MTTSMDNNNTENKELPQIPTEAKEGKPGAKKKKKAKGPIRFEAIGAIILFSGLCYGYTHFFFDSHIASIAEWSATRLYGAEVNIGKINTSFTQGSFSLKSLQVTNKENPSENMLQVGEIRFNFLWDALLRAKFVVEDASIENIQVYAPRKKPGRILPKEKTALGQAKDSEVAQDFEKAVIEQGLKKYSGNALGDIAAILGGKDPSEQLNEMKAELKTENRINELVKELDEKEKVWDEKIKSLTNKKELDDLVSRANNFKLNKRNPIKSTKELSKILKDAKNKVKEFNETSKLLKSDVKKYSNFIGNVDDMIDQDIDAMMKRLKIPEIDVADMSKEIFAGMFLKKLGDYKKYADMAREYAPAKKTAEELKREEEAKIKAHVRKKGKNYHFAKKKGYPFFWLKKSVISSKASDSEFSGNIRGELTNVTNEPSVLGKPARLTFEGDFPHQKIMGVKGSVIVDRTGAKPLDKADVTVASFPVGRQKFSDSPDLKLELAEANGDSHFNMTMEDQKVEVKLKNNFKETKYNVDAQGKEVKEVVSKVVNGIPVINLNASATGTSWNELDWDIDSNFGKELGRGIKREVKAKIDAAKKKVERHVKDKIQGQKDKLMAKFNGIKGKVDKAVAEKKQEVDKVKNKVTSQVEGKKKSSQNTAKKSAKKAGKKALDKLKKKFKLKF